MVWTVSGDRGELLERAHPVSGLQYRDPASGLIVECDRALGDLMNSAHVNSAAFRFPGRPIIYWPFSAIDDGRERLQQMPPIMIRYSDPDDNRHRIIPSYCRIGPDRKYSSECHRHRTKMRRSRGRESFQCFRFRTTVVESASRSRFAARRSLMVEEGFFNVFPRDLSAIVAPVFETD